MDLTAKQHEGFTKSSVVIVGAGFSGMCTAIKLLENGIRDFIILEKSTGFGGTWKDNTYPGCCCDVFSTLYSFSFEQNPNWSRLYPAQGEILDYMQGVASKYNLYPFVRFSSEVKEQIWDPKTKQWNVTVQVSSNKESEFCTNYTIQTNFIVTGVGQLNQPFWPTIPGHDRFGGKIMHSARWDWSYDLRGKRVAIIGNGATAVQVLPEIAKVASHVTIFQRTPNWVIPRLDREFPPWVRSLLRNVPLLLGKLRAIMMDGREAYYNDLVARDSKESAALREFCKEFIQQELPDRPDLWKTLTPDYAPGCKRILISDDYYAALRLPNVTLETRGIETITENGIQLRSGGDDDNDADLNLDLDLIVYATGFQTNDFMKDIHTKGDSDKSLDQVWDKGAYALYGVTVETLPNFGMLYGPNTNLGHNSIVLMIEAEVRYLIPLIKEVLKARQKGQALSITPRTERVREWNLELQKELAKCTFSDPLCSSWYKNEQGLVTNNWSGTVIDYQKTLSKVDWSDFDIVGSEGEKKTIKGKKHLGRVVEESWIDPKVLLGSLVLGTVAAGGWLAFYSRGRIPLLR